MKVFIICSVRNVTKEYRNKLEDYTKKLESQGYEVHLPHRDTDQNASGFEICMQNMNAIKNSDEVHIFYNSDSKGTHFDMGVAFALNKKIKVIENEIYDSRIKSFAKMLDEWSNNQIKKE